MEMKYVKEKPTEDVRSKKQRSVLSVVNNNTDRVPNNSQLKFRNDLMDAHMLEIHCRASFFQSAFH
jgi:hypothetical protein